MAEWNQCFYCGKVLGRRQRTYDHYIPESYGGDKFVVACKKCNNLKGDATVDDFRVWMGVEQFYGELQGWQSW